MAASTKTPAEYQTQTQQGRPGIRPGVHSTLAAGAFAARARSGGQSAAVRRRGFGARRITSGARTPARIRDPAIRPRRAIGRGSSAGRAPTRGPNRAAPVGDGYRDRLAGGLIEAIARDHLERMDTGRYVAHRPTPRFFGPLDGRRTIEKQIELGDLFVIRSGGGQGERGTHIEHVPVTRISDGHLGGLIVGEDVSFALNPAPVVTVCHGRGPTHATGGPAAAPG